MREVVFVFGSNLAGRHGKGAALEAVRYWGAEYGVGQGRTGNSYAIPTKGSNLETLSLSEIQQYYNEFWAYASASPLIMFLLTPFGTGLAGYTVEEITSIINSKPFLRNIWLSGDWFN